MTHPKPILASSSPIRAKMLADAGVSVEQISPRVDEDAVKAALLAEGHGPQEIADALAEIKATKVSGKSPNRLVIGADQVLEQDGTLFNKPSSPEVAKQHLKAFSARRHRLISAAVIAEDGRPVFRAVQSVTLHVRPLSEAFIDDYLSRAPASIFDCVGGYQLEGFGAQLFSKVEGDYFTVLGLPLLDILGYLRERGHLIA